MTIFLDIDGVLNQLQEWYIDDNCVEVLSKICSHYNANLVLISSWRLGYCRNINYCTPQVINLINKLNTFGLTIYNRTYDLGNRELEVVDFVKRYNIDKYIILDDDKKLFNDFTHLYLVSPKTGLTIKDYKHIVRRFG